LPENVEDALQPVDPGLDPGAMFGDATALLGRPDQSSSS
jgi:hypothetical protein